MLVYNYIKIILILVINTCEQELIQRIWYQYNSALVNIINIKSLPFESNFGCQDEQEKTAIFLHTFL